MRNFARPHLASRFLLKIAKKRPAHTSHTRTHIAHVRRCKCAKFRTSIPCEISHIRTSAHIFSKKIKTNSPYLTCMHIAHISHVRVRTCEFSHVRTFAHIFSKKFKTNSPNLTCMHIAHISHVRVRTCEISHVRTYVHILSFFSKKHKWPHLHAHCTRFARVRVCEMCEILHIHTFAHNFAIFAKQLK